MNDIANGVRRKYYVVGLMVIEDDVTPEVADEAMRYAVFAGGKRLRQ